MVLTNSLSDGLDLVLLLSCAVNILIAFIIISKSAKTAVNLSFLSITSSLVIWVFSNFMIDTIGNVEGAILWTKISGLGIIGFVISLLLFSDIFPEGIFRSKKIIKTNIFLVVIFALLMLSPDLIISDVNISVFPAQVIYGDFYKFLIVWIVTNLLLSFWLLIGSIRRVTGVYKSQIKLLLVSFSVVVLVTVTTNLILPVLNFKTLTRIGPITTIWFCGLFFLLIVRYRFLDIRILIGKITYFSIVAGITYIAFYLSIAINTLLFGSVYATGSYLIGIVIAVLFVVLFNWFNKFVLKQINSRLISPDYDPNEVVANLNSQISTILSYEQISEVTIATLAKTLRSSYEGIIVTRDGNNFDLLSGKKENLALTLPPLVQALKLWKVTGKVPILVDQIELEMPVIFKNMEGMLKEITDEMKDAKLKALYPLGQESQIVGILLIGSKDSEAPYNSVERAFMASIADIAGLALTRAFLYQEVQDFNVTLQHKIELATQEIQDKNKKLQDTINFERDMLDILGHELRTPLGTARNAIMTLQKMSKDKTMKEESTNQLLDMSANQLRREIQLLETILASTKVDNAKLDLNIVKISAQKVIDNSYNVYAVEAKKKNLELSVDVPKEELFCSADELRIQQVIDNIVSNAIKYTPEGTVKIVLEDDGDMVKFSITDTGEGIPESEIPNLGKKFYRVNNYLKSDGKLGDNRKIVRPGGTGIGLYVVFELTKAMKGRVEVKSVVGKGSTFSIYIPKSPPEADSIA